MWELLEISIPAVVLVPLVAVGALLWVCFHQNARSSDVRRSEFQRLQRLATEEHERAERELEREYMRHKQGDSEPPHRGRIPQSHGDDIDRRGAVPGNGYGLMEVGLAEWRRDPEADARRRKHAGDEEQRKKQEQAELHRRNRAEADEFQRQQEELADRKRRENLKEDMRRRQADEQEWQKRRADLEAQARREAEEERRRLASELEQSQTKWKQEALNISPRNAHTLPVSSLCVVCQKPTKVKRRCARCKSMNYCSRECQVQHWTDGHKFECRPHDTSASPRGSVDGDSRNFSDLSPRS